MPAADQPPGRRYFVRMRRGQRALCLGGFAVIDLLTATLAHGQTVAAHAALVWHWTRPSADFSTEDRVQLVHPMIMAGHQFAGHVGVRATVNFEGLALPNGELVVGNWGEGFLDRRHPHAYVHEFVVDARSGRGCRGRCALGAFVGRGFVPFGSDDPMTRRILRYPVNHHLAQILERAVVGLQAEYGPVRLEGALFNGDEPERPGQWPRIGGRFGDSWAVRLTAVPRPGLELSGSRASVKSPEHRPGAGPTQQKHHAAVRYGDARTTALAEWARTSELDGFFVFESLLLEAGRTFGELQLAARLERTDRPEEERLTPTRSLRPHLENSILGVTRWTLGTFTMARVISVSRRWSLVPTLEMTRGSILAEPGAFDLDATYGRRDLLSFAFGLQVRFGAGHSVLGRYGLRRPRHEQPTHH